MSNFTHCTVSDVADNFDNIRVPLSAKQRENLKKVYPYYGAQNIIDYVDSYLFDGEYILVAEDGENLKSANSQICNLINGKFWVNNHAHIIKAKNENVTKYLYYYLNLINFRPFITGSAQPKLTKDNLCSIPLSVHSPEDQKSISSVLSVIDDKIELNNKINNELEQMAKTLYDYWFVQFDFPDANDKPYKSSDGAMVFNDDLKCKIPKDWRAVSIESIISKSKNGDWGEEKISLNLMKVYCVRGADINALNGQSANLEPPVRYIRRDHQERLLKPDDLMVEISGGSPTQSTGRIAHIGETIFSRFESPLVCSNFCKAISLKDKAHSYILKHYWNKLYESEVFFNFEGKTSGIKNLMFDRVIQDVYLAMPSDNDLVTQFHEICQRNDELIQTRLLENQKLAELRDWLLPMLMNGQVTIK